MKDFFKKNNFFKKFNSPTVGFIIAIVVVLIVSLVLSRNNLNHGSLYQKQGSNTHQIVSNNTLKQKSIDEINKSVVTVKTQNSLGSGFFINENGNLVTNYHVIKDGGNMVTVETYDHNVYQAQVVSHSDVYDIALLKLNDNNIKTKNFLTFNKDTNYYNAIGSPVYVFGSPFGLSNTVTYGIISYYFRPTPVLLENPVNPFKGKNAFSTNNISIIPAIQTDAAINSGNSGGPVVDLNGLVVGISFAIQTSNQSQDNNDHAGNIGIGFAIPSIIAIRTINSMLNQQTPQLPCLGVLIDLNYNGVGAKMVDTANQEIVLKNGPSYGKLKAGDVILSVDNYKLANAPYLNAYILTKSPGDKLKLIVQSKDSNKPHEVNITVGNCASN